MANDYGYNSSMYGRGGMFNKVNAGNVYFAEEDAPANPAGADAGTPASPVTATPVTARSIMGKPSTWWLMLVIVMAIFVFVSRKFGGPEKFGNIRLTLWNGLFAVGFYIIVLNFMKVTFSYVKIPGWSELVAAA